MVIFTFCTVFANIQIFTHDFYPFLFIFKALHNTNNSLFSLRSQGAVYKNKHLERRIALWTQRSWPRKYIFTNYMTKRNMRKTFSFYVSFLIIRLFYLKYLFLFLNISRSTNFDYFSRSVSLVYCIRIPCHTAMLKIDLPTITLFFFYDSLG